MYTVSTNASFHGIMRVKERCNVKSRRAAENLIRHAIQRGKGADDYSSMERVFLLGESMRGCRAVAYNNFCYILADEDCCVTMFRLPAWFGKKKPFDGKTRIRKMKRYRRNMYDCTMEEIC